MFWLPRDLTFKGKKKKGLFVMHVLAYANGFDKVHIDVRKKKNPNRCHFLTVVNTTIDN